jgi:1-acyl-sn-glycerol-3-phosphate acyltransferase/nucleoside-diphosphate-sugar epimerase
MTLEPLDPRTGARAPQAEPAQPPARWLLVSPDDEVGRRLAARLRMTLGMTLGMPLGTAPEEPPGSSRFVSGTSAALLTPGDGERAWDAVVYRPPRWSGSPGQPDLADATAFFAAFAQACGGSGAGGRDDRRPRLVLISSAAAVSPSHHHPGWAAESERPQGRNPIARAWLELEALAAASPRGPAAAGRRASAELIVLRPAAVAAADGEDVLCSVLRGRIARVPAGFDPTVQLLSPDDLAGAVEHALRRGAGKPGIYHVAPAGAMPLRAALRLAGARRLPLGVLPAGGRLDYLRHGSTVSGAKIERELGFTPRASSAAAVLAELARPGDQRDQRGRGEATAAAGLAEVPQFDPYGQDKRYIAAYGRTLFRFLHDAYWRIEYEGLENVPAAGRAVLTGVHRGFMPWDGVMALHLIARELDRHPRFLIHPTLIKFPFLANYMTKLGGIIACQENADWVLGNDELLGMFPEGIQGAFTMYRDAYRLGRFGRDEYVKMALRHGAPIVPFVTVGSAEIYPILWRVDSKLVRRVAEWPFLPIAPNFPLPGLPLPSKWHTRFLEPLPVGRLHPPEAAEDPEVVRAISREVRARMETAIQGMLARRKSIFRGAIFERGATGVEPGGGTAA